MLGQGRMQATAESARTRAGGSPWQPLREPLFRAFWIAGLASNIGSLTQDAAAAWLMAGLSGSPLMVSALQAAGALPIFLLALPGGALADVVDRRRLMIGAQCCMLLAALGLAVAATAGRVSPWLLLAATFALSAGSALYMPAAQASVGEMLPHEELPRGIVLGGLSLNVARALGPLLGGLLVARAGAWAAFLLNTVSFAGLLLFLVKWRHVPRSRDLPAERFIGAITGAVRYTRHAPALKTALARGALFAVCASALWSLLPLLARRELGLGAVGYGAFMGCVGVGALAGAALLPGLRQRLGVDRLIAGMSVLLAGVALALGHVRHVPLLAVVLAAAGLAWLAVFSSLSIAAGSAAPGWIKGRGLAVYLVVFQGSAFASSLLSGAAASRSGIAAALTGAPTVLALRALAFIPLPLARGEQLDLTPSGTRPPPQVAGEVELDRGPVLVTLEYDIAPEDAEPFTRAMEAVRLQRYRDGAFTWGLFEDVAQPGRFVEFFLVDSWVEHLRQHGRVTVSDLDDEERARRFHRGNEPPRVSHLVAGHARRDS